MRGRGAANATSRASQKLAAAWLPAARPARCGAVRRFPHQAAATRARSLMTKKRSRPPHPDVDALLTRAQQRVRRPARRAPQAALARCHAWRCCGSAMRSCSATARPRRGAPRSTSTTWSARPRAFCGSSGGGRMGALQARRRSRPHPGRRGAGYEPRAVAGDPRAGRGVLLRAAAPATARARCLPSATRSSRSTASRARRPQCSPRRATSS